MIITGLPSQCMTSHNGDFVYGVVARVDNFTTYIYTVYKILL